MKNGILRMMIAAGTVLAGVGKALKVSGSMVTDWLRTTLPASNSGPSDEALEGMRQLVVRKALTVLEDAWLEEARDPLTEEEFYELMRTGPKVDQQIDFQISYEDEHPNSAPSTYRLPIHGKGGMFGHIEIDRKGRSLADMRNEILKAGWQHYRKMTNRVLPKAGSVDEEAERLKERYIALKDALGLKAPEIAEMTDRSIHLVNGWAKLRNPAKLKVPVNYPPLGVVAELQRYLQMWASDVLSAVEQERKQGIFTGLETAKPEINAIEAEKGHHAMWERLRDLRQSPAM